MGYSVTEIFFLFIKNASWHYIDEHQKVQEKLKKTRKVGCVKAGFPVQMSIHVLENLQRANVVT